MRTPSCASGMPCTRTASSPGQPRRETCSPSSSIPRSSSPRVTSNEVSPPLPRRWDPSLAERDGVHGDGADPRTFRPVVDSRAHEHVVDQITFGIRSGLYEVGEKLPSVAGLAEQFQVSKPTIGEAIRLLSESGVVASKRGVMGGRSEEARGG